MMMMIINIIVVVVIIIIIRFITTIINTILQHWTGMLHLHGQQFHEGFDQDKYFQTAYYLLGIYGIANGYLGLVL